MEHLAIELPFFSKSTNHFDGAAPKPIHKPAPKMGNFFTVEKVTAGLLADSSKAFKIFQRSSSCHLPAISNPPNDVHPSKIKHTRRSKTRRSKTRKIVPLTVETKTNGVAMALSLGIGKPENNFFS